jgi:hypothetical protein
MNQDIEDAISHMNIREQAKLVLPEVYQLHFIEQLSTAKQIELLRHSAGGIMSRADKANEELEIANNKVVNMHDRRAEARWHILKDKRNALIDKYRQIELHLKASVQH